MSAPVIERRPATSAPSRIPAQRGPDRGTARDERLRRLTGTRRGDTTGRAKFVLVVMTLLACGLVATLWLSTAAAADSYRLQEARTKAGSLSEQSEQLRKQVTAMNSPGALADRAAAQGLVPVQDPARLVVAPDGRVDVVGEPAAARAGGPTPPSVPAPQAPAAGNPTDPAAAPGATTTGTSAGGRG